MTTLTPEMIERAARALRERNMAGRITRPWDSLPRSDKKKWIEQATCALSAALGEGVTGWKLVPVEPTPEMIAAAFPVLSNDDGVLHEDKVIGAGAVMLLEGGSDLGQITGQAVEMAALLCRDYRAMLAASPAPAPQPISQDQDRG